MSACSKLETCALLQRTLADLPAVAAVYLQLYCHGRPDVCARLWLMERLGQDRVPHSLFPNQRDRAQRLIRAG